MSEATSIFSQISSPLAAFSSVILGEDSLLDDLDAAGDDLARVVDTLNSNDDDLHGHPSFFLAATAAHLYLKRQRLRVILLSHETRSQPPKKSNTISKLISLLILSSLLSLFQNIYYLFCYLYSLFTNQDLISCLHLLVNDTLSDKEFFTQLVSKS